MAFRLWEPADLERIEAGLRAAGIPSKQSKEVLKQDDPKKWRLYLLGRWRGKQNKKAEVKRLYKSKRVLAEELLRGFVAVHPALPVTVDSWYTQPAFCRMIDQELALRYVGALAEDALLALAAGEETVGHFAARLRQQHHGQGSEGGVALS